MRRQRYRDRQWYLDVVDRQQGHRHRQQNRHRHLGVDRQFQLGVDRQSRLDDPRRPDHLDDLRHQDRQDRDPDRQDRDLDRQHQQGERRRRVGHEDEEALRPDSGEDLPRLSHRDHQSRMGCYLDEEHGPCRCLRQRMGCCQDVDRLDVEALRLGWHLGWRLGSHRELGYRQREQQASQRLEPARIPQASRRSRLACQLRQQQEQQLVQPPLLIHLLQALEQPSSPQPSSLVQRLEPRRLRRAQGKQRAACVLQELQWMKRHL